jgi:uncharacterized protein (TIGR02145 family)
MKTNIRFLTGLLLCFLIVANQISYGQTTTKTQKTTTQKTQTKSNTTGTKTTKPGTKSPTGTTKPGTKSPAATTKPGTKPAVTKSVVKDTEATRIGAKSWALANLDVVTFRNGDTIPEAKTNEEWVAAGDAGKPAWCYYNNDKLSGKKFGKLYNWYAVNDPRGLAPKGWKIPGDADWLALAGSLGGSQTAGKKMKSTTGWAEGGNGNNESGFNALPGGYRKENGIFDNAGSIGIWWSSTEAKALTAVDFYLPLNFSLNLSANSRKRGESVRCIRE